MLRNGLIQRLLDFSPSVRVVLASPLMRDPAFVSEFSHPRVVFEDLPPHRPERLEARLLALVQAAYLDSGVTEAVRIRRQEAIAKKSIRWIRAKSLLASALAPSVARKSSRYDLSDRLVSHPHAEALFDRYQPSLLVSSNPGLILAEVPLLRTAVRRKVPTIAVDASWDNFTNKILPVRRVTRLIVWNELMKQQAIDFHGYESDEIKISGVPHWDLYFRENQTSTREEFFRRIHADPSRKLVTLTTTPRELYEHYEHLLRVMMDAMNGGRWPYPSQILVRVHPRDDIARYKEFAGVPNVIVEKPFRETVSSSDGLAVDITVESQQHLADTLRFSDCIVQVASTIAVEAAIFDTPVVNVSFDGEAPAEWTRSARRYLRFTHFANVVRRVRSCSPNHRNSWSRVSRVTFSTRRSTGRDGAVS